MKNFKYDKKKIMALFAALGFCIFPTKGKSEVISYNQKTTLIDGVEVTLYFITGNTTNDYAYISTGNQVGYVSLNSINIPEMINKDFRELQKDLMVSNDAYIYLEPNTNTPISSSSITNPSKRSSFSITRRV